MTVDRDRAFHARYSRWDGSQELEDLDGDDVLDAISDGMLAEGDLNEALRRLLERGMPPNADRQGLSGLRDLLERIAARRREVLERHGLGDVLGDVRKQLEEIVETERRGIARRLADGAEPTDGPAGQASDGQAGAQEPADATAGGSRPSPSSGQAGRPGQPQPNSPSGSPQGGQGSPSGPTDPDMRRMLRDLANRRREALDALPRDVGERIRALEEYDFMEPAAREAFDELVERLRGKVADATFEGLAERLRQATPEDLAASREMVQDLDQLLQERLQGRDPDVSGFLSKYGDMFPGAETLDDIIEQLADRMAAMASLLASLSPDQRAELASLTDALLRDDRLRWDLLRLASTLDRLLPGGLGERLKFRGDDQLSLDEAIDQVREIGRLDRLADTLAEAGDPAELAQVDPEEVRRLLGEESAKDLQALQDAAKALERAGYAEWRGDRLELTARGHRRIGQKVLDQLFAHMRRDGLGGHPLPSSGSAGERTGVSRPYEFGRPFDLDIRATLENALGRPENGPELVAARRAARPRGRIVHLAPADFAVHELEDTTRASTVLLVDMSRSMLLRGCFLAAKKVALALDTLIRTRYPHDELHVVGFAYVAREIPPGGLVELSWHGYEYGTNLQHGLLLARRLLSRNAGGNRSIIVVTDGEPTAHIEDGRVEFNYPPTRRTIEETLKEVGRCTRDGITINTFMLERSRALTEFVERLTRMNRGRAFYADPDRLGEYVLVDYVDRRTRRIA